MKKSKIIGLSLISALLVFSLTNVSHAAAPPAYVRIDIGDSFEWVATANIANINSSAINVLGAENWTLIYNMLDELVFNATGLQLGSLLAGGMKVNIKNFSDEVYWPGNPRYVEVFAEINVSYQPDVWEMIVDGSYPSFMIINPADINETSYFYLAQMPLFFPLGLNFGQIASWIMSNITGLPPLYNNITVTGLSDGLRATVLGSFLEWLAVYSGVPFPIIGVSNAVLEVKWNAKGVFSNASLTYGGLTFVMAELLSEEDPGDGEEEEEEEEEGADEIPGYLLPVFLGVGAIAIIGTISIIRRKKQIK